MVAGLLAGQFACHFYEVLPPQISHARLTILVEPLHLCV